MSAFIPGIGVRDERLPRRAMLLGAAASAVGGLLAACGLSPTATAQSGSPTPTAAPTRVVTVPTISPVGSPLPRPTIAGSDPVAFVWKTDHGLLHPGHIVLDGRGGLYVTDDENQRVQKFDTDGQFLLAWGSKGSGDGQFLFRSAHQDHSPIAGIAVDARGVVSVCDSTTRLQMFDATGVFLGAWSVAGAPGPLPVIPSALTVDTQGAVYVVDTNNSRVERFTSGGQFLGAWGSIGAGDGQFSVPSAIAADRQGNVYVVDINNNRVQKFDRNGAFVGTWGASGFADGRFNSPSGIAVDTHGDVYVADTDNHRVQKFTSSGQFVTKWGGQGVGNSEFRNPTDVAVDEQGNIYVVDDSNNRIQKFRPR